MSSAKISLLIPSRARAEQLKRMVESVRAASAGPVEVVVRIDQDDPQAKSYRGLRQDEVIDTLVEGPRLVMSDLWNDAARHAHTDIMMLAADDLVFKTRGWDVQVAEAFDTHPDKIILVYGSDGHHASGYATHPIIHRRWVEAVGRFTAPYFSSDYADTWLWDVSGLIGRRIYLPFLTDHLHYSFGKGTIDQTMQENLDRRERDKPAALYAAKAGERKREAQQLLAVIEAAKPAAAVARVSPLASEAQVQRAYPRCCEIETFPQLSVLVPTLPQRKPSFDLLLNSLLVQAAAAGPDAVEILTLTDSGELSVGTKRNKLLAAARGVYTLFCDDDDRVFGDYLALLLEQVTTGVDCICLTTLNTFDGARPVFARLGFSASRDSGVAIRDCGIHLCPVKRSISSTVLFPDLNFGEDRDWSVQVKPLIKSWVTIAKPVYHYDFSTQITETQQPGQIQRAEGARRGRFAPPVMPQRLAGPLPRWGAQRVGNRPAPPVAPERQRLASDAAIVKPRR